MIWKLVDAVIVVVLRGFERLSGKRPGFKEYLMNAPSFKDVNLERDRSPMRETEV